MSYSYGERKMNLKIWLIIFAAFAFRTAMLLSGKSIWGDEWMDVLLAQAPIAETFWGAIRDVHPPLYFLLLKGVVFVFGNDDTTLRSLSFFTGVGSIYLIYRLAKRTMKERHAQVAALLSAVSPYWLQPSNEIRGYMLLGCLTLAGTVLFLKAKAEPARPSWRWSFAFVSAAAVYTEHYAWFWLFAMFVFALGSVLRKEISIGAWIPVIFFLIVSCAPSLWLIGYQASFHESAFQLNRIREFLEPAAILKKSLGIFWHFACGYVFSMVSWERLADHFKNSWFFWVSGLNTAAAMICVLIGWFRSRKEFPALWALSGLALVLPILFLTIIYPVRLEARYITFAAPYFFLLFAAGVFSLKPVWLGRMVIILALFTSVYGSIYTITLKTDPVHKEDYIGLSRYLAENAGPNDAVCFFREPVEYYNQKTGRTLQAVHFPRLEDLQLAGVDKFEKVYYVFYRNMTPAVTEIILRQTREQVEPLGLEPVEAPIVFGGEDGLLCVYIFEKGTGLAA